jgi:hypothetical protein
MHRTRTAQIRAFAAVFWLAPQFHSKSALTRFNPSITFHFKTYVLIEEAITVNPSYFRLNLSTVAASEPDGSTVPDSGRAAVPEPSCVLSLGIVALAGTILKRRTKRKALQ